MNNNFINKYDIIEYYNPNYFEYQAEQAKRPLSSLTSIVDGQLFSVDQNFSKHLEKDVKPISCLNIDDDTLLIFNPITQKFTYIFEAPEIKNLVISGGGAKGVILLGVLKAFEEYKKNGVSFRDQLENIAGSSVGAINAALIAVGLSADDLIEATSKADFIQLLGNGIGPIFKDGKPLIEFMKTNIQQAISQHFKVMSGKATLTEIDAKELVIRQLSQRGVTYDSAQHATLVQTVEQVLANLNKENLNDFCMTFNMLHQLRQLDPKVFKDLTVTGTCRENGETFYFDAEKTPNLDITTACRASASLPIILKEVSIARDLLLPGYAHLTQDVLTFVDGGYLNNIPVNIMENKQTQAPRGENGQNLQTLALVFDETGHKEGEQSPFLNAYSPPHALYDGTNRKEWIVRNTIAAWGAGINTKEYNTIKKEEGLENIRINYTQRNIPLSVAIKTNDFEEAKILQKDYEKKGYEQTIEYLRNHSDEMIHQCFDTFEEVWMAIPEEKRLNVKEEVFSKFINQIDKHLK